MQVKIHGPHHFICHDVILFGEPTIYFDGEKSLFKTDEILALIENDHSLVRYVSSDVDLVKISDEKIVVYSSSQSSGIFFRFFKQDIILSKDERDLINENDKINIPSFKHQIMFREFGRSFICPAIKRNSPLMVSEVPVDGDVKISLNLRLDRNMSDFTSYYEKLWQLCFLITKNHDCATLFSGGIDSVLMALGVTDETPLVHYAYKDFAPLEQALAQKMSKKLGRSLQICHAVDAFSSEKFKEYSRHILPCVIGYKMKFNWLDYDAKPYLLTGQNADSFIYGDSFNKSNLRGNPGRTLINIFTIPSRLKYLLFSHIKLGKRTALKLYFSGSMDAYNEHSTFKIRDLFYLLTRAEHAGDNVSEVVRSLPAAKLSILQWIKIFKILRILHNVNYNGRSVAQYTGVSRINPYSNAYMIEMALSLKYELLTVFIPKFQSFKVLKRKTGITFFKELSACETWTSSISRRDRNDESVALEKIEETARGYGVEEKFVEKLKEINFWNWLKQ